MEASTKHGADRRRSKAGARPAVVAAVFVVALAFAPAALAGYAANVAADGANGYWRLGEQAGTSAQDETTPGNSGTYLGGVVLGTPGAADDQNTGITLSGLSYMNVGNATALNPGAGITLEAWVKPLSGTFGTSKPVLEKGFTSWAAPYFQYTLRLYDSGAAPQNVGFSLSVAGTKSDLFVNSGFRMGVWNHLVATYDGTNMRIYKNGAQIASKAQTGTLSTYATPLTVGCSNNRDKTGDYCYRGEIDEVAVYNQALTATQVQAHYQAVVPAGAPAPLTAPAISGSTIQGQTLTATSGTWSGSPLSYAFQWKRCSTAGALCSDISGDGDDLYHRLG